MFSYEVNLLCSNEDCCEYLVSEPQENVYKAERQVERDAIKKDWHLDLSDHFCPTCKKFSKHETPLSPEMRLELTRSNIAIVNTHLSLPKLPKMITVKLGLRFISLRQQEDELQKELEDEKKKSQKH